MRRRAITGGALGILVVAGIALARPYFPGLNPVPNLANVPGNSTACQTCHVDAGGGAPLNAFGLTVQANLSASHEPDWSKIYNIDSDGDGFSNGLELGDPMGLWRPGQINPGSPSAVTHPGNSRSKPPASIKRVTTPTAWAVIKALFR